MTAAQKQSPAIMHLEYRILLPDHDWVVAERHKLIPSVYAAMRIDNNGMGKPDSVTYSGPTYIAIRSGKHSSSTALTHQLDFNHLLKLEEFKNLALTNDGKVKPVVIFSVDGGPDENPRYPKVISCAIKHFKENDLDAVFIATNAPGRSAFNRVERRMAPLSHCLSGVVLPHDTFGNHLDGKVKTTDCDLEMKNFANAGQILAEIWSATIIDGEAVVAEYIPPSDNPIEQITNPIEDNSTWYFTHVQESQYFLQVIKCGDGHCCNPPRSDLRKILPKGFMPAPLKLRCEPSLTYSVPDATHDVGKFIPLFVQLSLNMTVDTPFKETPYDFYCPSVQNQLKDRICSVCSKYFASKKAVQLHKKNHGLQCKIDKRKATRLYARRDQELMCCFTTENEYNIVEWEEKIDVDVNETASTSNGTNTKDRDIPVVDSISDWLLSPWAASN